MNIKNIYFFDFDNTLVEEPEIYKGNSMTYEEDNTYMESIESLEYNFELKESVSNHYKKAQDCDESLTVILTNRTIKLKNEVLEILSDRGVNFDASLFRRTDRSKGNRMNCFLNIISQSHKIENVHFWDDKTKHINDVERMVESHPNIKFKLNLVK